LAWGSQVVGHRSGLASREVAGRGLQVGGCRSGVTGRGSHVGGHRSEGDGEVCVSGGKGARDRSEEILRGQGAVKWRGGNLDTHVNTTTLGSSGPPAMEYVQPPLCDKIIAIRYSIRWTEERGLELIVRVVHLTSEPLASSFPVSVRLAWLWCLGRLCMHTHVNI
jgi:hypothetical protein